MVELADIAVGPTNIWPRAISYVWPALEEILACKNGNCIFFHNSVVLSLGTSDMSSSVFIVHVA